MMRRLALFTLSCSLFLGQSTLNAQAPVLAEDKLDNQCFRIELTMSLKGKMTVQQEGKPISFPQAAQARHVFTERVLDSKDGFAIKTVRHYQQAEATLTADKDTVKKTFSPGRELMVAHRVKDTTIVYSPNDPLTQEEMELTEHFDTLHLAGLLPGKATAPGETWKVPSAVVQALCDFDGLEKHALTGKLENVAGNIAHLTLTGDAHGIDMGAPVDLLINAKAEFDLKQNRLTRLTWQQTDERSQGPISPALSVDVTIELARTPIAEPQALSNFALVRLPNGLPPEDLTALSYTDGAKRFSFHHSREWQLVGVNGDQVVLRLMDQGDMVAQATFTPWKKAAPDKTLTLQEFADLMSQAPGWVEKNALQRTDNLEGPAGIRIRHVSAEGELEGRDVVQFFYLAVSPQGDQMIVTFTMEPRQVQKLASRDLALVRGLRFEANATEQARSK